jgi:uncharacterized lipoprotein YehR (DUF1307 family)
MKKFNIILLLSLIWMVSSCDDKAEMNYVQKNYLVGQWKLTKIGTSNAANGIDYAPNQEAAVCGTSADNIFFNGDLSYVLTAYDGSSGTCNNIAVPGTYTLNGHTLTLTNVDSGNIIHTATYTVTKLYYTTLEVNYTDDNGNLVWNEFTKQ